MVLRERGIVRLCLFLGLAVGSRSFITTRLSPRSVPTLSTRQAANNPLGDFGKFMSFPSAPAKSTKVAVPTGPQGADVVRRYFELWNERKMDEAISLFTEDCSYEDTLYPEVFAGKDQLRRHLLRVADALPDSFAFCVDTISDGGDSIGVQWHVENAGSPLPFTRGSSMYRLDPTRTKIAYGFDVPEPTVKSGSFSLAILSLVSKLLDSPARALPLGAWLFYNWFVFVSDVAPGPNALQLDPATWQEVLDLSLNFWLITPTVAPDLAPIVHPVLEGVFNLLLAWAALFSGFMIDGRRKAPALAPPTSSSSTDDAAAASASKNGFLPFALGMQLLTNAVYLPYLVFRPTSKQLPSPPLAGPLTKAEAFGESKRAVLVFAAVCAYSVWWAVTGRPEFGDWGERWTSFVELASSDRLTFSFVVDLAYFAVFQGWLMDDDLARRGVTPAQAFPNLSWCKRLPVVGLVYYLLARPPLPLDGDAQPLSTGKAAEVGKLEGGAEGSRPVVGVVTRAKAQKKAAGKAE